MRNTNIVSKVSLLSLRLLALTASVLRLPALQIIFLRLICPCKAPSTSLRILPMRSRLFREVNPIFGHFGVVCVFPFVLGETRTILLKIKPKQGKLKSGSM